MMTVLQTRETTDVLRPDEGLIAVQLVFITLFDNAMQSAPTTDLKQAEQLRHMKAITRLSSHVSAWPARALDHKQRM